MTNLSTLLEMVKNAEGPSRELDCLLWAYFDFRVVREHEGMLLARSIKLPNDECVLGYIDPGKHSRNFTEASSKPPFPKYTGSIDAALELVERELPGCVWTIEADAAWLRTLSKEDVNQYQGHYLGRGGKCTALAILSALISAKIEGGE